MMNSKQRILIVYLLGVGLSILACGPSQLLGPTVTPTPLPTATPTNTPAPTLTPAPTEVLVKPGRWENEIRSVTFEVTPNGYIREFKLLNINISFDNSRKCDLEFPPMPIKVSDEGMNFEYIGNPTVNLNGTFDSETTVTGRYYLLSCGNVSVELGWEGNWNAEWVGP